MLVMESNQLPVEKGILFLTAASAHSFTDLHVERIGLAGAKRGKISLRSYKNLMIFFLLINVKMQTISILG